MDHKVSITEALNKWQIPLEEKWMQTILKQIAIPDGSLRIKGLYGTDVALAMHLHWKVTSVGQEEDDAETIKRAIGKLLRLLRGYAEQFGWVLPVIAVIEAPEGRTSVIQNWAADQDWHRGDFSLFPAGGREDKDNGEALIRTLLSSASTLWSDVKRLTPLTPQEYLVRLKRELYSSELSPHHASLLRTIATSWEEGRETNSAIQQWLEQQWEDITNLLHQA
ncbi:hypothetical protein V3F56_13775 [Moorellaceae bacterium AZ2]